MSDKLPDIIYALPEHTDGSRLWDSEIINEG